MSTPRFIADLHMGHKNIYKYRKVFESALHNDLYCMGILEETCTKRDTMWFLGDCIFDEKYIQFFKDLPGHKYMVLGNHDTEEGPKARKILEAFDDVYGLKKYKEFWLQHAPMHPLELRERVNIHGHGHDFSIPDVNYLNVSMDSTFTKYYPRTLIEVRAAVAQAKATGQYWDGIKEEDALEVLLECPIRARIWKKALEESRKVKVYMP